MEIERLKAENTAWYQVVALLEKYVESENYGKFTISPLERGFGTTIGNALRRVMLSSLPGSAISSVKIEGVLHEFQTIDGIYEDVTTIILNLKGIVFKNHSNETKTVRINVSREGEVTAGDIECDADVEVIKEALAVVYDLIYANNMTNIEQVMSFVKEKW